MDLAIKKTMQFTVTASTVDVTAPLIYMWEIHDAADVLVGRYIGKANGGAHRPLKHYKGNVDKLLDGQPYRNGGRYRRVHVAMGAAVEAGHCISLTYLCNVPDVKDIFDVERYYIRENACDTDDGIGLNGRWKVDHSPVPATPALREEHATGPVPESAFLEDFLAHIEAAYPRTFEIRAKPGRYSLWIGNVRILRALQSGAKGKVTIKQAQSSLKGPDVSFTWDGSARQIDNALDAEMALYAARHGNK